MFRRITMPGLMKAAAGVLVGGTVMVYWARSYAQNRVRHNPYYTDAMKILLSHEQAMKQLGSPVIIGAVEIDNLRQNFIDHRGRLKVNPYTSCFTLLIYHILLLGTNIAILIS